MGRAEGACNSVAPASLVGDGDSREKLKWAVQFPQLCSLCCPAPTLPAAYTGISTQHPPRSVHSISQTKSCLPPLLTKRGRRATSLLAGGTHACTLGSFDQMICMGEEGIFFILSLLLI